MLWINAFGVIVLGKAKEILEVYLLLGSCIGWKKCEYVSVSDLMTMEIVGSLHYK